jgi:hypothetical protein
MRFNIGFTLGTRMARALATRDKRLTMLRRPSLKINAAEKTAPSWLRGESKKHFCLPNRCGSGF